MILKKSLVGAALIAAAGLSVSQAHATVIAGWTFESTAPTSTGPFTPETGAGAASTTHATATTVSSPAGNGSAHSFSSNVWAVGDFYEYDVTTTGAPALFLSFDQTSSGTGPGSFQIQVSTDPAHSGASFTNFGSAYTVLANASPNPTWNATTSSPIYTTTVDLSSVTGLTGIRFVDASTTSAAGGTVASGGTDRMDNVIVQTTPFVSTPEPASLGVLALGGLGLLARRRK